MRHEKFEKTKVPGLYRLTDGTGRWWVRAAVRVEGQIVQFKKLLPATNPATGAPYTVAEAFTEFESLKQQAKAGKPSPAPEPTPLPQDDARTIEQYCVRWLSVRISRLSPSTAVSYTETINDRILPRLGWMACRNVTRQAIESWVVWIEAARQPRTRTMTRDGRDIAYANPNAGQPYTQDTMRKWWRCAKTILGDMAADFDIKNPVARVRQPERPELPQVREQRTLDTDGTGDLLTAARQLYPQHYACIAAMTMLGARAGEVFALKWDVVDFKSGRITIRRALSKGVLREQTKTKAQRIIPMHPELAAILLEHRQKQIADQHPGLATGLLFPTDEGKLRIPANLKKIWPALAAAIGSEVKLGSQVLRRSLNTNLVMAGVDRITTRALLGHTSEAMTQRYAGIGDEAKADAVLKAGPRRKAVEPADGAPRNASATRAGPRDEG